MQGLFVSNTPLAANKAVFSPWVDVSGYGDLPYVGISILADQAGSVQVFESHNPTDASVVTLTGGGLVTANVQYSAGFTIRKRFVQVVFTNGANAQTGFQLTAQRYMSTGDTSNTRLLDLILRELRLQNLLLMEMREPYGSTMSAPPSLDQSQT